MGGELSCHLVPDYAGDVAPQDTCAGSSECPWAPTAGVQGRKGSICRAERWSVEPVEGRCQAWGQGVHVGHLLESL